MANLDKVKTHIRNLVLSRNYPCIAAVQSFLKDDYRIGLYEDFGETQSSEALARQLLSFRDEYRKTKSTSLSFFAVFSGPCEFTEEEFEKRLWRELSGLSAVGGLEQEWKCPFQHGTKKS